MVVVSNPQIMDYKLKGKKVFISGSTSGIGLATAEILAKEGAIVIINGRGEKNVTKAIDYLKTKNKSAKISGIAANFSIQEEIQRLIKKLPDLDILINNVGIYNSKSFYEIEDKEWYNQFNVNVMSGVRLSKYFLPKMLKKNWGRIIFISSECAYLVPNDLIPYSMTKASILAVSRGLAQLTKGTNITVNTILPGSTLTQGAKTFLNQKAIEFNKSLNEVEDEFFSKSRGSSLIGRFASVSEVANAIAYLSSPLSSATNGSVLKVDGGSVGGIS